MQVIIYITPICYWIEIQLSNTEQEFTEKEICSLDGARMNPMAELYSAIPVDNHCFTIERQAEKKPRQAEENILHGVSLANLET